MAYFVGKTLGMRPQEILTTWTACELSVAFGVYLNDLTTKNYAEWEAYGRKGKRPEKYGVEFIYKEQ